MATNAILQIGAKAGDDLAERFALVLVLADYMEHITQRSFTSNAGQLRKCFNGLFDKSGAVFHRIKITRIHFRTSTGGTLRTIKTEWDSAK